MKAATAGEGVPGATLRLDELSARQTTETIACAARLDDLGVVVSSGGSTGVPKGSWRTFAAYTAMVDLGRIDLAGRLHILGSAADTMVVDGRILTLTMVENVLCESKTYRYASTRGDDEAVRVRLRSLAGERRRFGYAVGD